MPEIHELVPDLPVIPGSTNYIAVDQEDTAGAPGIWATHRLPVPASRKIIIEISQTGTNAPVLNVKFNSTGITPTPARTSAGVYTVTMTGAFSDISKVIPSWNLPSYLLQVKYSFPTANVFTFETYLSDVVQDDVIDSTSTSKCFLTLEFLQ